MSNSPENNFFGRLVLSILKRPHVFLGLSLILSLLMLFSALQIQIDSNIINLLPKEQPATQSLLQFNKEEGGAHFLNITFKGGEFHQRKKKLQEVAQAIKKQPLVARSLKKTAFGCKA